MDKKETLVGYARCSTHEQNLDLQLDALKKAGCVEIFEEPGVSGSKEKRPVLDKALAYLRPGETLVVWKLDRLGRSLSHLISVVNDLKARDIGFKSLTEGFDTTTNGGRLVFHIMGALAQFERDLIIERTKAGLAAAKEKGGRRAVVTKEKAAKAEKHLKANLSVAEAAARIKVSRAALYNAIKDGTVSRPQRAAHV